MKKIQVQCPKCSKIGYINVGDENLENIETGLLAIEIAKNFICEHFFVVYIDKNGDVRNYCMADFQLEVKQSVKEGHQLDQQIEDLDLFLIKINIFPQILTYMIKAIVLRKSILIITKDSLLDKHIVKFFDYITQDSFELNLTVITIEKYKKMEVNNDFDIIFQGNKIIRNKSSQFSLEELDTEESIVQKFLQEEDLTTGLVVLKNELTKLFEVAKFIIQLIKEKEERKKKINPKKVVKQIDKNYNLTLSTKYLDLVYSIIQNYFSLGIPKEIRSVFQLYLGISLF